MVQISPLILVEFQSKWVYCIPRIWECNFWEMGRFEDLLRFANKKLGQLIKKQPIRRPQVFPFPCAVMAKF